ncbi:MAG TPA: PP2C family protein-serine/threonine phosphatase [Terriglobia bacterium]
MNEAVSRLACFELWGGNTKTNHEVELPGLVGWVHSDPLELAAGGGDVHYFSVCSHGRISRIALADVAGHGGSVSGVAERLRGVLERHTDSWDQSVLMRELNDAFLEGAVGVQYATAAVLGFYVETSELLFSNAGHPPSLWYRAEPQTWHLLQDCTPYAVEIEGLPLGIIPGTSYSQTAVRLGVGDLVILYTDGLTEVMDAAGNQLGSQGLLEIARRLPAGSPGETAQALLAGVQAFGGRGPRRDDATVVVLRRVSEQTPFP